ncbi:MAG TPA: beta-glucosidase BglX [Bdellovibrionales bacterium]|nr:beta-glucosidase BglX [Bdellovibrionales bacterium]
MSFRLSAALILLVCLPAFSNEKARFIDSLLRKMTVEEKAGQLTQYSADMEKTGPQIYDGYEAEIVKGRVGSIFNAYTPEYTRRLQKLAVERSRLKIPLIFGYDVIHGHRTIFPIPLGESASWDLHAIEQSARIAATEASADGVHWTFAPMVDISRDPRWGRVSEGAGEDPYLGSKIAAARVRGFQTKNLASESSVLATVKHFAAYGAPEGGRDYNVVDMSDVRLFEDYLPPYEAAIREGAGSVMTAFNEIAGVPSTSNRWLLTDLLRGLWKFAGFVVTDYTAVQELVQHGVAANDREAARLGFTAGADMSMQDGLFGAHLPELIKERTVSMERLDQAVRRVLEAKYDLGLFKDPYRGASESKANGVLLAKAHREKARDIARRSIVLLKNEKNVLPLDRRATIAVIGPMAKNQRDLIGNWSAAGDYKKTVSLYQGLTEALGSGEKVLYARGSNILEDRKLISFLNEHLGAIEVDERAPAEMIEEAVEVARRSDVVVLALGESQGMSGEAASRTRLRLPENQLDLLRALKKTGRPIVLVLMNGRPLVLETESLLSDAVLETWFLGTEAGRAIADVLLGDYNPSGKLTMSFPAHEGQIPIYYSMTKTGRPATSTGSNKYVSRYLDAPNEPLYPFGWGLSYTSFEYSDPRLSEKTLRMRDGETLSVIFTLTNTGRFSGEETAQLYVRDVSASMTRPLKQLRGFKKVYLNPGESREVEMRITLDDLKFFNRELKRIAEPGEFEVMVGGNSNDLKTASFWLIKK